MKPVRIVFGHYATVLGVLTRGLLLTLQESDGSTFIAADSELFAIADRKLRRSKAPVLGDVSST
jgi:hypothetical protein